MIRKLLLFCLAAFVLPLPSVSQTAKYDQAFRQWGQFYFPWHDWHYWKAQGIAESGLNPAATSWCGATGIMQFMPATAKSLGVDARDPESSIQGGIRYDRSLWGLWRSAGSEERLKLTFASYNAGPGNIQRAAKLVPAPPTWPAVAGALPRVTGAHSSETVGYVARIWFLYGRIR